MHAAAFAGVLEEDGGLATDVGVVKRMEFAVRQIEQRAAAGVLNVGRDDGRNPQRHRPRPLGIAKNVKL